MGFPKRHLRQGHRGRVNRSTKSRLFVAASRPRLGQPSVWMRRWPLYSRLCSRWLAQVSAPEVEAGATPPINNGPASEPTDVFASSSHELSPEALRRLAFEADQSPPFAAEARVHLRAHAASAEDLEAAASRAALVARMLVERGFPEAQLVLAESRVVVGADPLVVTLAAECTD
jgi:hypothetical protein